jgi:pyruvate dehydrogenase E1 component
VRNLWWVIDYNRQSLDSVVNDRLFGRVAEMFELVGWRVVTLKYGRLLQAAFAQPDGEHLRQWIDDCPNSLYSALVYKGGAAWREALTRDLNQYPGIRRILDSHDDGRLHALMTNLAGLDLEAVLEAFEAVTDDRPTCFIAYTIKGRDLPFAGPQGQPRRPDERRADGTVAEADGRAGGRRMGSLRRPVDGCARAAGVH